jgi:hypothetical protein
MSVTEWGLAGRPSSRRPADLTVAANARRPSASASSTSAIGERQMLPVQSTRTSMPGFYGHAVAI